MNKQATPAPATPPATPGATPVASERVDVVIVGSGAAGSVMAALLAEAGKSVLILEGGPEWHLRDMISSHIWSRRLKYAADSPVVLTGGEHPLNIGLNSGWGTGGSAIHHYAVWLRMHESDFQTWSRFGVGADWPLGYDELRPYYDRVQAEVGLSGDAEQEVWRPAGDAYPLPPLPLFAQGELIRKSFDAIGIRTAPVPMAILSQPYAGRNACISDGWCDAGCPIGALANPLVTYLPRAIAAGARIQHHNQVLRVLTDDRGGRVTAVEYGDTRTGEIMTQEAAVVVLAAYAIETPRILLNSADGGLANSSGVLGQYMMSHASKGIYGLFAEETQPAYGVSGGQLTGQDAYELDHSDQFTGGYTWQLATASKPNDLLGIANARADLFGQPLVDFLHKAVDHIAVTGVLGHNLPSADSRLTLAEQTDRFGMPIIQSTHAWGEDDLAAVAAGVDEGQRALTAGGATEVWAGGLGSQHILGGVRMGSDPADSVCDSYGRTHDLPNLFVAGSSLFPTSNAVNPTFTIHALTVRAAEWMTANWPALA